MILVTLFAASFFFSAEYKICSQNEYTHTKECTSYHYGPYVFAWLVTVTDSHNGLITAIATVFVAIFTWTLWSVTGRAVSLAREEFISTHRPKIVLREVDFVDNSIIYIFANIGGTEATVMESWIMDEALIAGQPVRSLRSFGHDDLGRLKFAAGEIKDFTHPQVGGGGVYIRFPSAARIITEDGIQHTGEVHFTGAILYADTGAPLARLRKKERWSSFASSLQQSHSVREAARQAGFAKNTSFRWRHRFLRLDKDTLKQKLTGIVEIDEVLFWKAARVSAGCQERRASAAARPKSLGFRTNRPRC